MGITSCIFHSILSFVLTVRPLAMELHSQDPNLPKDGLHEHFDPADPNRQFYDQYQKIIETGYFISQEIKQLVDSKEQLWSKLLAFEKKAEEEFKDKMRKEAPQRKKRSRRTADEIEKKYTCEATKCSRSYGSEGSLHQHVKLKHPELLDSLSGPNSQNHNESSS